LILITFETEIILEKVSNQIIQYNIIKLLNHEILQSYYKTRSTGTEHTSAKTRLNSIAIWIRIRDPDRHQSLTICSLAHCQPSLKIVCKSFRMFFAQSR